jgi:hypothetical protein
MADKGSEPSRIAAEAVGERPDNPPREFGNEDRPSRISAGPQARVAAKTAESVGERAGEAYADATTEEARKRSHQFARQAARRAAFERSGQSFATVFLALALGYVTAFLLHSRG